MGGCCSCFKDGSDEGSTSNARETEMSNRKTLSVSRAMTAPTIEVANGTEVSGMGLSLVGTTIEQDAAYWEVHIDVPDDDKGTAYEVMFGVATKKDRKFYNALAELEEESPDANGTDLMRKIPVKSGAVVGVAVQQADLPMVQFLLDGEPLHTLAINRFRGAVYPAVYLPENEGLTLRLVFNESDFSQMSPHGRFGPLIIATSII